MVLMLTPWFPGNGLLGAGCEGVQMTPGKMPLLSFTFAFSFPIPFRFASQLIKMFSWAMPEDIREAHLDEIIVAVEDSISTDEPIEVYVDEEDGNHVEIFIC